MSGEIGGRPENEGWPLAARSHRESYPEQYSHPLVDRTVRFREGPALTVVRVARSSRWGEMAFCCVPDRVGLYIYRVRDLTVLTGDATR